MGLARVSRAWNVPRAGVYRFLKGAPSPAIARRPGPTGPCPDADLADHIRREIRRPSDFHGERLSQNWGRDCALQAGVARALAACAEIARLKSKVGEITMDRRIDCSPRSAAMEAKSPLATKEVESDEPDGLAFHVSLLWGDGRERLASRPSSSRSSRSRSFKADAAPASARSRHSVSLATETFASRATTSNGSPRNKRATTAIFVGPNSASILAMEQEPSARAGLNGVVVVVGEKPCRTGEPRAAAPSPAAARCAAVAWSSDCGSDTPARNSHTGYIDPRSSR